MTASAQSGVARKSGYHHGDLGAALVAAVRALVERDGPDLSVSEACRMAGVSTAAPYKHFKGKNDILRRVVLQGFEELAEGMRAARDACPGDCTLRIAEMGKAYVRFARANPGTFRLVFGKTGELHDPADDEMSECSHGCFDVLIAEVAACLGAAPGDPSARQASLMLWTFVHGAASLSIDGDYDVAAEGPAGGVNVDAMIETATAGLLRGG